MGSIRWGPRYVPHRPRINSRAAMPFANAKTHDGVVRKAVHGLGVPIAGGVDALSLDALGRGGDLAGAGVLPFCLLGGREVKSTGPLESQSMRQRVRHACSGLSAPNLRDSVRPAATHAAPDAAKLNAQLPKPGNARAHVAGRVELELDIEAEGSVVALVVFAALRVSRRRGRAPRRRATHRPRGWLN